MKRWLFWIVVIVAVFAIGWYYLVYRGDLKSRASQSAETGESASSDQNAIQPAHITWQTVERPQAGIKVEMPAGAKDIEVPAYNMNGSTEQVEMLSSNADSETTFALTWEDNPPVARANRENPERTLEAARDGMLERTETNLITQSQATVAGFPALDLTARNAGGGILDARLIYANSRLYTLIAAFPSLAARRQKDVERFYNSFTPAASRREAGKASS
ncbi:MAG: hypothetical protein WCF17_18860 [Terracidiphilus sp.]